MVAEILVMDFVSQKREQRDFNGMRSHACVLGYKWLITLMIKVGFPPSPFDVA